MQYLKQSTASQSVLLGPFVDDTDGATAETALTIANTDILLSKNGATQAAKNSGGGTHDQNGWYAITLDATDTNTVGRLQISCKVAGALAVFAEFQVLEEAVYDALFASGATGKLPATLATADVTGNLPADVIAISGDTTAADNAELAFDGTGYGFTGCTMPTVTTLTGHTAQTGDNFARLGAPVGASISADIATVDTVADGIQADLDNATDGLGALKALIDTVDSVADGIQTDLDNGTDGLGALLAAINVVGGYVDTEVAAILVDTGTTLNDHLLDIKGTGFVKDTHSLPQCLTAAGTSTFDPTTDTVDIGKINGVAAAAVRLALSAGQIIPGTVENTTTTPTTTVFAASDVTEATADHFNGRIIIFTTGALAGQATIIEDYELASGEGKFTVQALTEAPADTDTFVIV